MPIYNAFLTAVQAEMPMTSWMLKISPGHWISRSMGLLNLCVTICAQKPLKFWGGKIYPNTIDGLMENTVTRNESIVNLLSRYYNAREEAGRQALIERRGEGVPKIINESEKLSGKCPEYKLIDEDELLLTIHAASKEQQQKEQQ